MILGGVESPRFALVGGFILGFGEMLFTIVGQFFIGVWGGEYRPILPTLILALVLYFAPEELFNYIKSKRIEMED